MSIQHLGAARTNASALGAPTLKANEIGYGLNLGAMFVVALATRVGVTRRFAIDYRLEGPSGATAVPAGNVAANADLCNPDSVSVGLFSARSPKSDLMGEITHMRWCRIRSSVPICARVSTVVCSGGAGTSVVGATLPTNRNDKWRVGLEAHHRYDGQWKVRMGVADDPTPGNDMDCTARLPCAGRAGSGSAVRTRSSATTVAIRAYLARRSAESVDSRTGPTS